MEGLGHAHEGDVVAFLDGGLVSHDGGPPDFPLMV
jgi:hypothetical protein